MKQYDIKGYVYKKGEPQTQFTVTVNANDQTSAKRLVMMQYGVGGSVTIQKILEVKPKK
jgi:ribosomal protein L20A (L18A)